MITEDLWGKYRLYVLEAIMNKFNKNNFDDISCKAGITLFLKSLKYNKINFLELIKKDLFNGIEYDLYPQYFYNLIYDFKNPPKCVICNKDCTFINISKGYYDTCSIKCANNKPEKLKKTIDTNLIKYGCANVFQNDLIKKKSMNTIMEKYGVDNVSRIPEIRRKAENTTEKKYGVKFSHHCPVLIDRMKDRMVELYGVENASQSDIVKEKKKKTCLKHYGVEFPTQSKLIKKKSHNTNIIKYGAKTYTSSIVYKKMLWEKTFNKLNNSDRFRKLIIPLFKFEEYNGSYDENNKSIKYKFKCVKCGNEFEDHIANSRIPRCYVCNPRKLNFHSKGEYEIKNFIESENPEIVIEVGNCNKISPVELDLYLPDYNIAIEYNGIYWHSELNGKNRTYHLNKTLRCEEKGIQLIHIFEDEWIEKNDIIKSMIRYKIRSIKNKINARQCEIKELSSNEVFDFLDNNHLQGSIKSSHNIVLIYNNEIVSCLSISKSRFSKKHSHELLRFCTKINYIIPGALSKLINFFVNNYAFDSIVTYADLRYGTGKSYEKIGFKYLQKSPPSYFIIDKEYMTRINRLNFQKHLLEDKLENYDSSLTEWENMMMNGYDRIWDCGCKVYEYINLIKLDL